MRGVRRIASRKKTEDGSERKTAEYVASQHTSKAPNMLIDIQSKLRFQISWRINPYCL
jgi:hypothetical protein